MKRGFTLIELMIVIVIMGIIYTVAINNLSKVTLYQESNGLSFDTLALFLKQFHPKKKSEIFCFASTKECKIVVDGNLTKTIDLFFEFPIKKYAIAQDYTLILQENTPFIDHDLQQIESDFSFVVYSDGSTQQVVIQTNEDLIDLSSTLQVKHYKNQENFTQVKNNMLQKAVL